MSEVIREGLTDTKSDALRTIIQMADQAKEPCGDDPESAAAIRNQKFASIAAIAAQALGILRGPDLSQAPVDEAVARDAFAALKAVDDDWSEFWPLGPDVPKAADRVASISPKTAEIWRKVRAALSRQHDEGERG